MTDKSNYSFNEVYDRIKFATNVKTQQELAVLLDIRQSSISDAKRRKSIPADWLVKLHDSYGLALDWLRFGIAPMFENKQEAQPGPEPARAMLLSETAAPSPDRNQAIVYKTAADYIDGKAHPELQAHSRLVLPDHLLSKDLRVFYLNSKSMEPTLRNGAYVGVSTLQRNLVSGELYALFMPHEGVVFRRIVQDAQSELFLLCFERPELPASSLDGGLLQARIIGRLRWVLQEI